MISKFNEVSLLNILLKCIIIKIFPIDVITFLNPSQHANVQLFYEKAVPNSCSNLSEKILFAEIEEYFVFPMC